MESTLADRYRDLIGEVGFNLGYGRGADLGDEAWASDTEARLKSYVKSGLRNVYYPVLDSSGTSHVWSWLTPTKSLSLASGAQTLELPDDFDGLEGKILVTGSSTFKAQLEIDGRAREMYALYPSSTGRPRHISLEPRKGTTKDSGQRWQFCIWPEADAAYTLSLAYAIQPAMLTGELPYAYGGPDLAECILESCLAVAEMRDEDLPRQAQVHGPMFRELLAAAISRDRKKRPTTHGYVGDCSDDLERRSSGILRPGWVPIRVNGEIPE